MSTPAPEPLLPVDDSPDVATLAETTPVETTAPGSSPVEATPTETTATETTATETTPASEVILQPASDTDGRRALVIGEALIDVVRRADGAVSEHPGGSPANVAIGLARLGRGVDLLTWYGDDAHGEALTAHLRGAGVDIVPGSDTAPSTSVATAMLDEHGVATYVFDLSWHVPESWSAPPVAPLVVHTGSIAAILEPGGPDVARILQAHRDSATITYDPNMRPSLMPAPEVTRPTVEALVALSDVVKVSDEDLAWLEPGTDPVAVARQWVGTGPAAVVVTRGGEGAVAVTADGRTIEVVAPRVTVADTVGAGDSFMGGLVDGLWSAGLLGGANRAALHAAPSPTWAAVLERCATIAAITVSRAGANPPSAAELDR